jgi:hypothetical protein
MHVEIAADDDHIAAHRPFDDDVSSEHDDRSRVRSIVRQ